MYIKPVMVIINLAEDEALIAMARCNGGAYTADINNCKSVSAGCAYRFIIFSKF